MNIPKILTTLEPIWLNGEIVNTYPLSFLIIFFRIKFYKIKRFIKNLALFIGLLTFTFSQEIPNEFLEFQSQEILYDAGEMWESHTLLGPIRFQDLKNYDSELRDDSNSLNIKLMGGLHLLNEAMALYGFGHFTYQKYFYAYLYPRIVNNPKKFMRYSGIPRDIPRRSFNSGETDISGIGFQNNWLNFQFGRGRESWGAGNKIQLALSENSPAYDYGSLRLNFGKLRVKYIHGFLESTENSTNRYITARGIEWTNQESFIMGISETVIYSGLNRPFDIGYFNPISTHLEIELNNRLNMQGTSDANAVWTVSLDWLIKQRLRISGNYLYDEFVLDPDLEINKEHGKAYSLKTVFSLIKTNFMLLNIYSSLIHVGTPTFRHGSGFNNFVVRNKPLGWQYGSDGEQINFGFNYFNRKDLIARVEIVQRKIGQESISSRPYDSYFDYLKGEFPSGTIDKTSSFISEIQWWFRPNISLIGNVELKKQTKRETEIAVILGFDIFLPKFFNI